MKTVALLIYPEFSMQEIADLMYIFRWFYDCKTVTYASSKNVVYSEEGIGVVPERTLDAFHKEEHHCLILSGCSDVSEVIKDKGVFQFLHTLKDEKTFVIGAICSGPMLLSMAGLLEGKKFTNSVPYELNKSLTAIDFQNIVFAPLVVDGNIVTAVGDAFRQFAIAIARQTGFTCRDDALSGIAKQWQANDFIHHITKDESEKFYKEELPFIEQCYQSIKAAMNI